AGVERDGPSLEAYQEGGGRRPADGVDRPIGPPRLPVHPRPQPGRATPEGGSALGELLADDVAVLSKYFWRPTYFNPWWHPFYRRGDLHSLQSVTKTVTSVLIVVARTRKEFPDLDTPLLKFFDASKIKTLDDRKRRTTIRHLLPMPAGQD